MRFSNLSNYGQIDLIRKFYEKFEIKSKYILDDEINCINYLVENEVLLERSISYMVVIYNKHVDT